MHFMAGGEHLLHLGTNVWDRRPALHLPMLLHHLIVRLKESQSPLCLGQVALLEVLWELSFSECAACQGVEDLCVAIA